MNKDNVLRYRFKVSKTGKSVRITIRSDEVVCLEDVKAIIDDLESIQDQYDPEDQH